jgi:hypothetical protein
MSVSSYGEGGERFSLEHAPVQGNFHAKAFLIVNRGAGLRLSRCADRVAAMNSCIYGIGIWTGTLNLATFRRNQTVIFESKIPAAGAEPRPELVEYFDQKTHD